jgi:glycosyltransferase involved in cell wall biosynthesis
VPTLEAIFPEFDVVIMPSRFEGLGLVAIEATLSGLPVVIADALGLREALPADYPWRAVPGDHQSLARALTAALAETQRWPDVVREGQRFAQARFSPKAMRDAYLRLYERAAGRTTPP